MISLNAATLLNGDGIDVSSLVAKVLSQESGQKAIWEQRQSELANEASLLTGMNSHLSGLYSAVNTLNDVLGPLSAMTAKSSQTTILTASAQPTTTPGTHTVVVSTLAAQGTVYSDAIAGAQTSVLPNGAQSASLQLQVGGPGGATRDITITSGSRDTLTSLVSYINQQNWGVTARVITDANGARLAVTSNQTGSTGALAITLNTSSLVFNDPVGGTNATFTVDGIPFTSTSNTVSDAIPGVALNLLGAYPGVQVQVSVAPDTAQAAQAIADFVSAYNTVIGDLNTQFKVDPNTSTQGPLAPHSPLRLLQSRLLADAAYSPGSGALVNLRSLGVTTNDDGTLAINLSKLTGALTSDPAAAANFFQKAQTGFAAAFANDLRILTSPTRGVLNLELAQNTAERQNAANSLLDLEDRLNAEQKRMERQFSLVNSLLESFPAQLKALQLMLGLTPSGFGDSGK